MSLYLALETATDRPTMALGTSTEPGADAVIPHRHDLSRDVDGVAKALMAQRGISPSRLAGIVVADGPGSFTGLRIGIAFAKGLARALSLPLLSAPSMLCAARAVTDAGTVVVDYDALRGDVYRAVYDLTAAGVVTLRAPALARADEPVPEGAGARAGAEHASAAALLRLIGVPGGAVTLSDPAGWEPSYGRPAEAEARRLGVTGRA